jgi:hypothetical protein
MPRCTFVVSGMLVLVFVLFVIEVNVVLMIHAQMQIRQVAVFVQFMLDFVHVALELFVMYDTMMRIQLLQLVQFVMDDRMSMFAMMKPGFNLMGDARSMVVVSTVCCHGSNSLWNQCIWARLPVCYEAQTRTIAQFSDDALSRLVSSFPGGFQCR